MFLSISCEVKTGARVNQEFKTVGIQHDNIFVLEKWVNNGNGFKLKVNIETDCRGNLLVQLSILFM